MNSPLDINRLADLASLSLNDGEKKKMSSDLQAILAFCDVLSQIGDDVPYETTGGAASVLREDVPTLGLTREELLASVKTKENGYITVPLVMKDR